MFSKSTRHTWVFLCAKTLEEEREKIMATVFELFLLGVGLSMDAFAVAVCKGLSMRHINKKQTLIIGL